MKNWNNPNMEEIKISTTAAVGLNGGSGEDGTFESDGNSNSVAASTLTAAIMTAEPGFFHPEKGGKPGNGMPGGQPGGQPGGGMPGGQPGGGMPGGQPGGGMPGGRH